MGLIKEPKNVNFTVQSKPWTEEELKDFRKIMTRLKSKDSSKKNRSPKKKKSVA